MRRSSISRSLNIIFQSSINSALGGISVAVDSVKGKAIKRRHCLGVCVNLSIVVNKTVEAILVDRLKTSNKILQIY